LDAVVVAQKLVDESCVQKVHYCVFHAAHVDIDGHHFLDFFDCQRLLTVLVIKKAQEVPG
jgi:hypothetical protein